MGDVKPDPLRRDEPPGGGELPPERDPGRPTGTPDGDRLRPGISHEDAPTEAPEERGETPAVEHAPGGDL